MKVKALKNRVLVCDLERGMRCINGILIPDDNGKSEGIRPRWGKVYSVGEGIDEVKEGQYILMENGRWTRMLTVKQEDGEEDIKLWGADWPNGCLLVADELPETKIFSDW